MKKRITFSIVFSALTMNLNAVVVDQSIKTNQNLEVKLRYTEEKFENEKLILVYEIFHNTTRQNIEAFMKNKNFSDAEIEPAFDDYGELLTFNTKFGMIEVEYQKNGKILNVLYMYSGAINNVFVEMDLKENKFLGTTKKFMAGKNLSQEFEKKIWTKSGTQYRFLTSADEGEKTGAVAYGILED